MVWLLLTLLVGMIVAGFYYTTRAIDKEDKDDNE